MPFRHPSRCPLFSSTRRAVAAALTALLLAACAPSHLACEVHGDALREGSARIVYGMIAPGPPAEVAAAFPHALSTVAGGCVVRAATERAVRFCPGCREAERAHRNLGDSRRGR